MTFICDLNEQNPATLKQVESDLKIRPFKSKMPTDCHQPK